MENTWREILKANWGSVEEACKEAYFEAALGGLSGWAHKVVLEPDGKVSCRYMDSGSSPEYGIVVYTQACGAHIKDYGAGLYEDEDGEYRAQIGTWMEKEWGAGQLTEEQVEEACRDALEESWNDTGTEEMEIQIEAAIICADGEKSQV